MEKKEKVPVTERLLDIREAAEFLNVSEMSIRRWTNSGALHCYRVGGKRERRFRLEDLEAFLRGKQTQGLFPLGFNSLWAPGGSHMTHFYTRKEEAIQVSAAFALSGLKNNEKVLVVTPPERRKDLMNRMQGRRRSMDRELETGQLNFSSGMRSPKDMIQYLTGFATRADPFRVAGDMVWALEKGWDLAALLALEQAADLMPISEKGLLLCQYSLGDFSGAHIMMAAESHRHSIYKGKMERSPYYTTSFAPVSRIRESILP
jgi:transcriptional repressor of dcmA and dcmR